MRRRLIAGVTLAELLVALGVGALVIMAAAQLQGAALRLAITAEDVGRIADQAPLLERYLRREIARAGSVPCGFRTPRIPGDGEEAATVLGASLEPAGLSMEEGALRVARLAPQPSAAEAHYAALSPVASRVTLELESPPAWPAPGTPDSVLVGGGCGLYALPVLRQLGTELTVRAPRDAEVRQERGCALPPRGSVWAPVHSSESGNASSPVRVRRLRHEQGGADEPAVLALARSEADTLEPLVRGVEAMALGFAECVGAAEPHVATALPDGFVDAEAVADWDAVCAVRVALTLGSGSEQRDQQLRWPLTVTIPIHGRLP